MNEHSSIAHQLSIALDNGHSVEEITALLKLFNESFIEMIPILYEGNIEWNKQFQNHPLDKETLDVLYDAWLDRTIDEIQDYNE